MKKKMLKTIGWSMLIIFLVGNFIAYNQAYRFTHFSETLEEKTKRPEQLSLFGKLNALFLGVNIPKPKNVETPLRAFETITLKSHEELEAWHVKIPNDKGTVILFHGYSNSKSSMLPYSEEFNKKGYSTLLVDFMGSGGSTGNATTLGYKESRDVKEVYEFIKMKNPNDTIILFGTSMGAVSIMKAIGEFNIKPEKIIIECPFGSLVKTTKARFDMMRLPSFPFAEMLLFYGGLQVGFDASAHNPTEYAKSISIPTLLFYGAKDERVSREETDEIYANLKGEKILGILEKSGHEVYLNDDAAQWHLMVDDFLE